MASGWRGGRARGGELCFTTACPTFAHWLRIKPRVTPAPQNLDQAQAYQAAREICSELCSPWIRASVGALLVFSVFAFLKGHLPSLPEFAGIPLAFACFGVVATSHTVVSLLELKYLKCPACRAIPAKDGNLLLDVESCERCGARLK